MIFFDLATLYCLFELGQQMKVIGKRGIVWLIDQINAAVFIFLEARLAKPL